MADDNIDSNVIAASASEITSKRKKPYNSTSAVWDHFEKKQKIPGTNAVKSYCKYCGKQYEYDSKNGTKTHWRHLEKCVKYPHNATKDSKQKILSFSSTGEGESNVVNWKFDQEACRRELARMIIVDELPFNFVDHEGFRSFCQVLQPKFQLLSRTTIRKDCLELYKSERLKLKGLFEKSSQRVCITTDMWTSIQNLGYMCLTAHYIDKDWNLHKKIINFRVIPSPHGGEHIGNAIELCLLSWGLHKINTITVDNASSNDVAVRNLKKKLNKKNGLLLDGEFFHVRCCGHIINLIVRDGIEEIKDSIFRIRSAVRYVRSSPSRLQEFKRCVKEEEITSKKTVCLDVTTRWNSTYFMLDSALEFQKAFERLEDKDAQYIKELCDCLPTVTDWNMARVLCKFLENFYNITKHLSGSKYVTANAYFHEVFAIEGLLMEWSNSEDFRLSDMGLKMKLKFDKYWGSFDRVNILLVVAVVLDPCYKLMYVEFCYSKIYPAEQVAEMIARIRNVMNLLFEKYHSSLSTSDSVDHGDDTFEKNIGTLASNVDSVTARVNFKQQYRRYLKEEKAVAVKSEIDRYLDEEVVDDSDFDILNWWRLNSSKYRVLSQMARDILAIPVSTVASESAFSTGGRVLDRFRSSLTPNIVESLVCGQDWLRVSSTPIDIEEKLEELEEDESVISELIVV